MLGTVPLVGRHAERAQLEATISAAADGFGTTCFVVGEAGIGKTRLIEDAVATAARQRLAVHAARAEAADVRRPFGVVAAALGLGRTAPAERSTALARALFGAPDETAAERSAVGPEQESRLADALVALVEDRCAEGPQLVAVDDVQWADPSSVLVLHRLVRAAAQLPLLVVLTGRPEPRSAALAALVADLPRHGVRPIVLGALGDDDVATLAAALLGADAGPRLRRQLAAAGGNPLFVTELATSLRTDGSVTTSDGVAEVDAVVPAPSLGVTVLHRMSFLATDVLEVLRSAAILGRRFSVTDLCLVTGRATAEVVDLLQRGIDARIVVDDGDGIAFAHDLLRDSLYDDVPAGLRAGLHRDVAVRLANAGRPAIQVAEHLVAAAARDDPLTIEWVRRAADEAAVRSPTVAADLLGRAVDLLDTSDPEVDLVLADWALSLEQAGRMGDADEVCRSLLSRRQDPRTEARVRLCRSRILERAGRSEEALAEIDRAMAVPGLADAQRARLRAGASTIPLGIPRLDLALELAEPGRDHADPVVRATSAVTLGAVDLLRGRYLDAHRWADGVTVGRDDEPANRMGQGLAHLQQGARLLRSDVLLALGQTDAAAAELRRVQEAADRIGFRELAAQTHSRLAVLGVTTDRWDDVHADVAAVLDLAEELDLRRGIVGRALASRALVTLHRGDVAGAGPDLERAAEHTTGLPFDDYLVWLGRARWAEASGAPEVALDVLAGGWDACDRTGVLFPRPALGPELARLATGSGGGGRSDIVDRVVAGLDALEATNPGIAPVAVAAQRCRALRDGDPDALGAAADAARAGPSVLVAGHAAEQAAEAAGRAGRADDARHCYEEAIAIYERLDAAWDLNRATAGMRAIGMRRGSRRPRGRPKVGWEALTASELGVVALVAEGLSNPQIGERLFIGRRTVQSHVSSALGKLGFTSRVELARESARRGAAPSAPPPASRPPGRR